MWKQEQTVLFYFRISTILTCPSNTSSGGRITVLNNNLLILIRMGNPLSTLVVMPLELSEE